MFFYIFIILQTLIIILALLISVAYLTLLERKLLALVQRRKGPNVVGTFGLMQPLADGFKLFVKEIIIPNNSNKFIFILAPVISFAISLFSWSLIPLSKYSIYSDLNLGILFLLSFSSIGVYGILLSGWSSNSKYSFLGALRSSAQMISYELTIGFTIILIALTTHSLNLNEFVLSQKNSWFCTVHTIPAIIFFISGLAETNRHPFDLPEAEAELVSGYNVEYSGMTFALFSLAEYSNILLMCSLNTILFWGGWLSISSIFSDGFFWFSIKTLIFYILFVYARAILPRYRYDQLMHLGWKILLPILIAYIPVTLLILYSFNILAI